MAGAARAIIESVLGVRFGAVVRVFGLGGPGAARGGQYPGTVRNPVLRETDGAIVVGRAPAR